MASWERDPNDEGPARDDGGAVLREEARHVLDGQLRILRETDRKALATTRVVAVILGLLLSAASLAENPSSALNTFHVIGVGLLLCSLFVAVLTYSVDRPSYGVGPGFIDASLREADDRETIERSLLPLYADWIDANREEIGSNSTYLLVAQGLLVAGLSVVAVGMYWLL